LQIVQCKFTAIFKLYYHKKNLYMKITESTLNLPNESSTHPFENMLNMGHEQVVYYQDPSIGLKAIVAIHNTTLGPALGGLRIWNYEKEETALVDALRLSRGMTYKSAMAGLDLGGGKAVLIGDVNQLKNEAYLRKYGQFIESLNGKYITAPDVNSTMNDMVYIAKETQYVVGLPALYGGSDDPSLATAYGVYIGIKAAAKHLYGDDSLTGKKIGVQGLGKVGTQLIHHLIKEKACVYANDILPDRLLAIKKLYNTVEIVADSPNFYTLPMDIYSPCALGATINEATIPAFQCRAIVGAANNQLADEERDSALLFKKDILYAPDFIVNAGGVINVHSEFHGHYKKALADQGIEKIYGTCLEIFNHAVSNNISTQQAAMQLANKRLTSIQQARL